MKFKLSEFKNTEKFYNEVFSIPLYIGLKNKQLDYITETIIKNLKIKKLIDKKKTFRIKNNSYSIGNTFVVAEAGSNHNQSLKLAKKLIDIAALAKCNAIKFQVFTADTR